MTINLGVPLEQAQAELVRLQLEIKAAGEANRAELERLNADYLTAKQSAKTTHASLLAECRALEEGRPHDVQGATRDHQSAERHKARCWAALQGERQRQKRLKARARELGFSLS